MGRFFASTGSWVRRATSGALEVGDSGDSKRAWSISEGAGVELREFFQHERDAELGRWRWPENPDLIVYKILSKTGADTGEVRVTSEATGYGAAPFDREGSYIGAYGAAARAYFDSHPEPKPWHGAKPGEVWVLNVEGVDDRWSPTSFRVVETSGGIAFFPNEPDYCVSYLGANATTIQSGRRIWPEAKK